jgi:hypothetical protein
MYRREPSSELVSVGGAFSREVVMELMAEGGCRYLDAFGLWATNAYPVEPLNGDESTYCGKMNEMREIVACFCLLATTMTIT